MELTIVRHGESVWNDRRLIQGQQDPALNEVGVEQARRVARSLSASGLGVVYTSDLTRARQTAQTVADGLGARLILRPDLREIGMGQWEGLTEAQARQRDPALHQRWKHDSLAHRPPNGESYQLVRDRVKRVLDEILAEGRDAAVVTHYSAGRALLVAALEAPLEAVRWFRIDNGSLSRLQRTGTESWQLVALNDTAHLAPGGAPPPYE